MALLRREWERVLNSVNPMLRPDLQTASRAETACVQQCRVPPVREFPGTPEPGERPEVPLEEG